MLGENCCIRVCRGRKLRGYKPLQMAEVTRLCAALVGLAEEREGTVDDGKGRMSDKEISSNGTTTNNHWEPHLDGFAASVVFAIAYGHRLDSLNTAAIRQRLKFMQHAASLNHTRRMSS